MTQRRRAGVAQKVQGEVVDRLKNIRALWSAVYNTPGQEVDAGAAMEFYYKIGELLEGKPLDKLVFHHIDRNSVLAHEEDF